MGCGASIESDSDDPYYQLKKLDEQIERNLLLEKKNSKNPIRLLLLGAGESGKSTVLKQMKILHHVGFTDEDRILYKTVIWSDAIASFQLLILQAREKKIDLDCDNYANKDLFNFKKIIFRASNSIKKNSNPNFNFLNQYLEKYSETSKLKRMEESTGTPDTIWDEGFPDQSFQDESFNNYTDDNYNSTNINELNQALNEDNMINPKISGFRKDAGTRRKNYMPEPTKAEIANAIKVLWNNDSGIKKIYARRNEFTIDSNIDYIFNKIELFSDDDYVCTDQDILNARIKTTGVTETHFQIKGSDFTVIDVGGQRSERKKWLSCFKDITAVIFVLAISEYDEKLFEDNSVNRIVESVLLFKSIVNSKWFNNTPIIVFLNKTDLFRDKIQNNPLNRYLPGYTGESGNAEDGIKYFENTLRVLNQTSRELYFHATCATDTRQMNFILNAVTDIVIQKNLKAVGLI